jgi:RimJ/RimL family protein N-acetyltransferase
MHELTPAAFETVRPLFSELEFHLSVNSILTGVTAARIFVDDPARPQAVFVWSAHRFYLAGTPHNAAFNTALRELFFNEVYPHGLAGGPPLFVLYYAANGWETQVEMILEGKHPIRDWREYFTCSSMKQDWRPLLPAGFKLLPVDRDLLTREGLANLDDLREETCSERASVEDFLAHSFGVCLVRENELAGWCLSEYNTPARCEVGIETRSPYQRRGLATLMTLALVEAALAKGLTQVGWDCWQSNVPSSATARKAGFTCTHEYPVHFAYYREADNLAVNGNVCLRRERYPEALDWFGRSLASAEAPDWAYYGAACAAARLEQADHALRYLDQAIQRGFTHLEFIRSSEHLRYLHDSRRWKELIEKLERLDC